MKTKHMMIWGLAVCMMITSINSIAGELQVLTCEEPPMNFKAGESITGFTTDIVREIMRQTNTVEEIQLLPWKRVYRTGLETPNVVLFTAARTAERENLFYWVGPVVQKRWILFSKKGAGLIFQSNDDAKKVKKIGVMRNDARHRLLENEGFDNIFVTEDHVHGLKMLLKDRVTLWASSDFEAFIIAKNAGLKPNLIEESFEMKTIQSYILISKQTPERSVGKWQDAFNQIKNDGMLDNIAAKWAKKLDMPLKIRNGLITITHNQGNN